MPTKIPVALLGFGDWGRNLARNFSSLGALSLICESNPARLAQASTLYPNAHLTPNLEEVFTSREVRAVVIATPASMHYEHAKQALLAGKDVFVEKPLALRLQEGKELVHLAKERGAILMVGHVLEYHPGISRMLELVQRGDLGRLWYIYSNRVNLGKVRQEENILWSFAPHDVSLICRLFGESPTQVSAVGGSYLQPSIADVTMTHLRFLEDRRAHIFVSWLHPYKEQRLVVIGEKKMLSFDGAGDGKLTLYDKGIEWRGGVPVPRQESEEYIHFSPKEPLWVECEHFLSSVESRTLPRTDGESALRVLQILEAAQISLEQHGAPVSL